MSFPKKRNDIPDYEDFKEGVEYCFTINPCDKYQFFRSADRITNCWKALKRDLLPYTNNIYTFTLYPEVSSKGRWHWHGTIAVHNVSHFYLFAVPLMVSRATVVIKDRDDEAGWDKYITKQHSLHEYIESQIFVSIPLIQEDSVERCLVQKNKSQGIKMVDQFE